MEGMIGVNVYFLLAVLLVSGMIWSVTLKKLTLWGTLTGGLCALLIFAGAGFTGVLMMTAFFIAGTAATSWRRSEKKKLEPDNTERSGRTAGQVLANAGVAAMAGALTMFFPAFKDWCILAVAGCFSSAIADTLSSELGIIYGKRFYNIISLKPDQRGLDGVVSLEGTLLGMLGSVCIALIYAVSYGWVLRPLIVIILAGTAGNLADSLLGALLERKKLLNNNAVNFLNTLIAALVAIIFNMLL